MLNEKKEALVEDFNDEGFNDENQNVEVIDDYYVARDDLNYYNLDEAFRNDDDTSTLFIAPSSIQRHRCRRCESEFSSNNKLHQHIRKQCQSMQASIFVIQANLVTTSAVDVFSTTTTKGSFIESVKFFAKDLFTILFTMNSFKNIDIEYEYREYNHAKIRTTLFSTFELENVCLDIDANVTLVNRVFFKRQISNTSIRTMIASLEVRGLDTIKHQSFDYAIVDIHLFDIKNGEQVNALIRREIHLVDNLKTNMLIDNDIIDFESIIIDMQKRKIFIISCDVVASLEIDFSRSSSDVSHFVHLRKTTIISPHTKMFISIHYINLLESRNFLFELEDGDFALYAHMIDVFTKEIIARNDSDRIVQISRNYRLDRVVELNFSNAF